MAFKSNSEAENLRFIKFLFIGSAIYLGGYLICLSSSKLYTKYLFTKYKTHNQLYAYETYTGTLNHVICISDLKDSDKLIKYYTKIAAKDTCTLADFDHAALMPVNKLIYVSNWINKNSNIIELIDFNTHCWAYLRGYAYIKTTHAVRAPDSLVRNLIFYESNLRRSNINSKKNGVSSPYGCFCND